MLVLMIALLLSFYHHHTHKEKQISTSSYLLGIDFIYFHQSHLHCIHLVCVRRGTFDDIGYFTKASLMQKKKGYKRGKKKAFELQLL